jgi:hypothetical protein
VKKYLPWIGGLLGAVVYFAIFETLAFQEPDRFATLSNSISSLGAHWPLSIFLIGFFAGGLASHFFWPWKANPLGKGGG